jgi:hypothetical protein
MQLDAAGLLEEDDHRAIDENPGLNRSQPDDVRPSDSTDHDTRHFGAQPDFAELLNRIGD